MSKPFDPDDFEAMLRHGLASGWLVQSDFDALTAAWSGVSTTEDRRHVMITWLGVLHDRIGDRRQEVPEEVLALEAEHRIKFAATVAGGLEAGWIREADVAELSQRLAAADGVLAVAAVRAVWLREIADRLAARS